MAKYQLRRGNTVFDTERKHFIPDDELNRHWIEYQKWLAAGGVPDPAPPDPIPTAAELLSATDVQMIRAIDWLMEYLVQQNVVDLADVPQALKDLYMERKAQRDALP